MNLLRDRALSRTVLDKFRRLEAGEFVDFSQEEAAFAGAFVEDAIRFEDIDQYEEEGRRHEQ